MTTDPSQFYTGLVADLYAPLRGSASDPDVYERFVRQHGEPALELGCGDGDPILELRAHGLDVDGIDASADMVERCRARAAAMRVDVRVETQLMETLDMGRTYRSIYVAGPTFNLLADDAAASAALERIAAHLDEGGCALVPLFIPSPTPPGAFDKFREDTDEEGRSIRFAAVSETRDENARTQVTTLRYERGDDESLERDWLIHWYTPEQFTDLAAGAGLAATKTGGTDTYLIFELRCT